jgi:hypothetical protein
MPSSTQASRSIGLCRNRLRQYSQPHTSRQREQKVSLFLAGLPLWVAAILLVVLPTIAAMCGPVLMRRRVGRERLASNNDIAGFKFATVGVIYAVLLAFAEIVVWEKFSDRRAAGGGEDVVFCVQRPQRRHPQNQDDITRAIMAALKLRLVGRSDQPFFKLQTTNAEAYELYL